MMRKTIALFMFCAGALPMLARDSAPSQSNFVQDFAKHWNTAKQLAAAVAEAMPAGDYDFKPNKDEMSFGEQMLHIAAANYGYCAAIAGSKSPFVKPANAEKATVATILGESFDYCSKTFEGLTPAKLDEMHGKPGHQFSTREIMLGVLTHMAHHRGQAEVYLRVKGITPPEYNW